MQEHGLRFYGRRKGKKLHNAQQDAYAELMPTIAVTLPAGEAPLDLKNIFGFQPKEIWFEIGFGAGEHILHQALNNPDVGLIGCEPFINGVARLCTGIREHNLDNIRIWPDDARLLMARLQPESLDRCFLLHPDPWPKTRHHKRRFIQQETLGDLHRLLKPGALLRMATDHAGLAEWMLEQAGSHAGYTRRPANAADCHTRPADMPATRYQKKGLTEGRPPVFLEFEKKAKN